MTTLSHLQLLDVSLGLPDIEALSEVIAPQTPLMALKIGDKEVSLEICN